MVCIKLGPVFDCVVGTWVWGPVFPEARTIYDIGVCPYFLPHLECLLSVVVKTHRQ